MNAPEPLIPSTIDVRDLDGFMLNVERLLASELVAIGTPEECWAALMLWCRAWKQVPAGSLPDDDRVLASFSGAGKRWAKVREIALHGFVKCSDGRLYHRFLCDEVMRAYAKMKVYRERREQDRKRLSKWREERRGNENETRFVAEDTGTGTGTGIKTDSDSPSGLSAQPDPVDEVWARGLRILGDKRRSLLGKLVKECGPVAVLAGIAETEAECPVEPVDYLIACCERRKGNGRRPSAHAAELAAFEFVSR